MAKFVVENFEAVPPSACRVTFRIEQLGPNGAAKAKAAFDLLQQLTADNKMDATEALLVGMSLRGV